MAGPNNQDALARRAFEAFYAALGMPHQSWGWAHLRPAVQAAWRVVVETVREDGEQEREEQRG